jgi:hypothetical protein
MENTSRPPRGAKRRSGKKFGRSPLGKTAGARVAKAPPEGERRFTPSTGELGHQKGLSWLKVFLEGDGGYRQFLLETPSREFDFRDNL